MFSQYVKGNVPIGADIPEFLVKRLYLFPLQFKFFFQFQVAIFILTARYFS